MKKHLLIALIFLSFINAQGQQNLHCGSDISMEKLFKANPTLRTQLNNKHGAQQLKTIQKTGAYVIPVVFHILHLGGKENITDAQVHDQMRILNIDYAKQNADTTEIIPSFKTIADSTNIKFVLATKDPQGKCTNGIVHYLDNDANWTDTSTTLYSYTWDPTRYMNIYVVKSITLSNGFSAAGYTYLPGSWPTGSAEDAIVMLHTYTGSIGTSNVFSSRVLTHEVGHWLDLNHTFGWNSCGVDCNNDDFVNDTPTSAGFLNCPNVNMPSTYQLCTPGIDENFQNFMDYSYCEHMFTHGQALRMQAALQSSTAGRNNLWTATNLQLTGVTNPIVCAPVANFNMSKKVVCVNMPVTYTDATENALPNSYAWSFEGGTPATSTNATEQVTYATAGVYKVTYTITNSAGSNTITKLATITVVNTVAATSAVNFNEDFENDSLFNKNWSIINLDTDAKYFKTTAATHYTGNKALVLNNGINKSYLTDEIVFPPLDFTGVTYAQLQFRYAYASKNQSNKDKLELYMQTNCAIGFIGAPKFNKMANTININNDLSPIAGNYSTTNYVPVAASATEWKLVTINNLAAAYGNSSVVFKFIFTPNGGNNLYIDAIQLNTNLNTNGLYTYNSSNNKLGIQPNPAQGSTTVSCTVATTTPAVIELRNSLGQVVHTVFNGNLASGNYIYEINTTHLPKGIYTASFTTNDYATVQKLIIQ